MSDLKDGSNPQARIIAEIIQHANPDVLFINELDYDDQHQSLKFFQNNYLSIPQNDNKAASYLFSYTAAVNTGVHSGLDLNNNGKTNEPDDAFGYGRFPGQYGMAFFSKYPIVYHEIRTFQHFLWKDMPGALIPENWYSPKALESLRLSSKSHWDLPVKINEQIVHFLCSHPTPPVFDGPEDRNGRRNHDEIRFWADYISPSKSEYIYDDNGKRGGLEQNQFFVILGDLNCDPFDGDGYKGSIQQLLNHPDIIQTSPSSEGAKEASEIQKGVNLTHRGLPELDTYQSDIPGQTPGNLRLDYILPCKRLCVKNVSVFWPPINNPLSKIVLGSPSIGSDHRLVYIDLLLP